MWWAYVELGWGGYWAWDPVENASLLPWLTMTAFLHSVMIQEKRGMLKRWNLGLIIGTFLLSIFGTFITRSGVIASVHSFTQSNVGYFFLGFLVVAAVLSLHAALHPLAAARGRGAARVDAEPRGGVPLQQPRCWSGIAFSVLWGTLFPILSEAVRGTKITVGPPFFNRVNVPLGPAAAGAHRHRPADRLAQGLAPRTCGGSSSCPVADGLRRRCWRCSPPACATATPLMASGLAGFVAGTVVQEFYRGRAGPAPDARRIGAGRASSA